MALIAKVWNAHMLPLNIVWTISFSKSKTPRFETESDARCESSSFQPFQPVEFTLNERLFWIASHSTDHCTICFVSMSCSISVYRSFLRRKPLQLELESSILHKEQVLECGDENLLNAGLKLANVPVQNRND